MGVPNRLSGKERICIFLFKQKNWCSLSRISATNETENKAFRKMEKDQKKTEFIGLINVHQKMLKKICYVYGADPEDRQDLFQEIVWQLWRSYDTFSGKAKFGTWLYRVALNTALYHLRKKKSRQLSPDAMEDFFQSHQRNDRLAEDIKTLYRAIDQLNKIDKAVILLYLEQKSYQEMAEILGITVSYVSVKLARAKEKLVKSFETMQDH
jgi:RNA polymerase sigma-70 factor (ECF subfamily)